MRARTAAMLGVALAVVVGALAFARRHGPGETRVADTARAARIVRRDRVGLPEKKGTVRNPARVRRLAEALGVDQLGAAECPADYADADIGIVLTGSDVYARRNVYVFGLLGPEAGAATSVVSVTSAGCRRGPPADDAAVRRELADAGVLD